MENQERSIKVQAVDSKIVEFTREEISLSPTIQRLFDDIERKGIRGRHVSVKVDEIESQALRACLQWIQAKQRAEGGRPEEEVILDFKKQHENIVPKLLVAAVYLELPILADIMAIEQAKKLNGKTVSEVRHYFAIDRDFTAAEEEELERQNNFLKIFKPALSD